MKTYPAIPFTEVYCIQVPASVRDDKFLNWTDRVAFWFFVHYQGDNQKVIDELGLTDRRFRHIKQKLAGRGHITRYEERGQIKYMPVDLDTAYWNKIHAFLSSSKVGFKLIPDNNIVALKNFHTLPHILHVLEVLEHTYRKSKETIKKPHHLLARSCKTGVTPAADFVSGFWEADEEKPKAKGNGKTDLQNYHEAKKDVSEFTRQRDRARLADIRKKIEGRA